LKLVSKNSNRNLNSYLFSFLCDSMNLTIVYDNCALPRFLAGWGFSCVVEAEQSILFDVGWDQRVLLHNLAQAGIRIDDIPIIVLSHAHWDHIGALPAVLSPEKTVYVPQSFSKALKNEISERSNLVEVTGSTRITPSVISTGELGSSIKEQALYIRDESTFVLTGCAHPGLETIVRPVSHEPFGVIGGFHGFDAFHTLQSARAIYPCHCTQHTEELKRLYPQKVHPCAAGCVITGDIP
jgi:7,8-dihydropterin-6-yl-methyl-4-(beta-D-ribofuranosyl)aminobenzene 5'-phosphate synthase